MQMLSKIKTNVSNKNSTVFSELKNSIDEVKNLKQYVRKPYTKKRFYNNSDVAIHNQPDDCWVSFFNEVFDLTELVQINIKSKLCDPIVKMAGQDITFWFDNKTHQPRTQIDLKTGKSVYYCPNGRYLHIPDISAGEELIENPWWLNRNYCIGRLTVKSRKIKIINVLTDHEDIIEVPCEETINEILERYKEINEHAASYTWKRLGRPLDMSENLENNNIFDETDDFIRLDIPEDSQQWYIPAIHLYFNDDLTIK